MSKPELASNYNSQNTAWATNIAAKDYNTQPAQTLSGPHSLDYCVTATLTV